MNVRVGTRGSRLAVTQTGWVVEQLRRAHPNHTFEVMIIKTTGDVRETLMPESPSDKGMFVKEIEEALLERRVDLAVHSLKDLPTDQPEGLVVGAVSPREDARDVLISRSGVPLSQLPSRSRIGTSSPRRKMQLAALRPDAVFADIKGNVDTRIDKVDRGEYDAVILAAAGLKRIGHPRAVSESFPVERMVPAPGQGALAIEIRSGEPDMAAIVGAVHDPSTRTAVWIERSCLQALGGGCRMPLGAFAEPSGSGWSIHGALGLEDESRMVKVSFEVTASSLEGVGSRLARMLLEKLRS